MIKSNADDGSYSGHRMVERDEIRIAVSSYWDLYDHFRTHIDSEQYIDRVGDPGFQKLEPDNIELKGRETAVPD